MLKKDHPQTARRKTGFPHSCNYQQNTKTEMKPKDHKTKKEIHK